MKIFIICLLFEISLCSCNQNQTVVEKESILNDTAEVLKVVLDSAINNYFIPDMSFLYKDSSLFGNSIIVQFDDSLTKHLKAFKNLKFKILTRNEICKLATKAENDSIDFPNFLVIEDFLSVPNSFHIRIQNTCVMPLLKPDSSLRFKKHPNGSFYKKEYADSVKCEFGFLCGGGFGIQVWKLNGNFRGKVEGRWSD